MALSTRPVPIDSRVQSRPRRRCQNPTAIPVVSAAVPHPTPKTATVPHSLSPLCCVLRAVLPRLTPLLPFVQVAESWPEPISAAIVTSATGQLVVYDLPVPVDAA
jgi:hypothetical protein